MSSWSFFLTPVGRIGRSRFWAGFGLLLVSALVAGFLSYALGFAGLVLGGLAAIVIWWLAVCLAAKRLHDLGRSGWWQFAPLAVALLARLASPDAHEAIGWMTGAWNLALLLWLGLAAGRPEPTRSGVSPSPAP